MGQRYGKFRQPNPVDNVPRSMSAMTFSSKLLRKRSMPMNGNAKENLPPCLSQRQKGIIKETFATVREHVVEVGVILFMRLFETHPEVQDVFLPFKGLSKVEMEHSKQLRTHALRVMCFVEKCIARIDQPEKLIALCLELGSKHQRYGAPVEYLDLIGPQFIYAIKPVLKNRWSTEVEEAWLTFFSQAIYHMKKTMVPDTGKPEPRKRSI